jgi:hypothetical protein
MLLVKKYPKLPVVPSSLFPLLMRNFGIASVLVTSVVEPHDMYVHAPLLRFDDGAHPLICL